jgi:hypothetical protein
MSNVIRFLETIAADAAASRLAAMDYSGTVASLNANDQEKQALLGRDDSKLRALLDSRHKMFCMIFSPEEEAPKSPEPDSGVDTPPDNDSPADH